MSNAGLTELGVVGLSGGVEIEAVTGGGHRVDPLQVEWQRRQGRQRLAGVAVVVVGGDEALVAPPQPDPTPVDGWLRPSSPMRW